MRPDVPARTELAGHFERCISNGGVVLFPSDTVYGLACDPSDAEAIGRLYELKRRPPAKASAVMFFDLDAALAAIPGSLGPRTRTALRSLMPGGVTALLPNPEHLFPLACGADPDTLGLRVVSVTQLWGARVPVLQSSANLAGGLDPRRLEDVPDVLRHAADLVIDGGELPGTASTVVDLRDYEKDGLWGIVRPGAVSEDALREVLMPHFHFVAPKYASVIREDIPFYDEFQGHVAVAAAGGTVRRILDLGTGTGETALRLLEEHPEASLLGIDESEAMLAEARGRLAEARRRLDGAAVELRVGRLQDRLPEGRFDLVVSALCVHHLDGEEKADLFRRVRGVLDPAGRFVLGDVVVPLVPPGQPVSLSPDYDKPDTLADQVAWLMAARFRVDVTWERDELAVIVASPV
ncbi:MAG TPA: Sua5/YciO/YrdC/YwlC family protein [Solirubrobacteraceae bacterium]|nr:Sua5/YciO/YrdC/YwlC family protein [Solirubrobacteraceae bacterium]